MANASILAAFERMWQHITVALGNKSDANHTHSEFYSKEDKVLRYDEQSLTEEQKEQARINIGVSGSTGSSAQPDYNQNDPTAADYIKNRPFYMGDLVETELVDVNAFLAENDDSWSLMDETISLWVADAPTSVLTPEVGKQYAVVINGDRYTSVATSENIGMDIIAFGDWDAYMSMTAGEDSSGFTYVVACAPAQNIASIMYKGAEAPIEFKIYGVDQEIVKIDPKYLPEGGVGYVESSSTSDSATQTFDIIQIANDLGAELQLISGEDAPSGKEACALFSSVADTILPIDFVAGDEYKITVNGVSYAGEAIDVSNTYGAPFPYVAIGDIECTISSDYSNFRYLAAIAQIEEGQCQFSLILDAETFGLTDVPTEVTITANPITETIHKIDPKFLPDHIQSDWNENDPNAEGYIANRPFYETYVPGEELLAEQTVETTGSDELISDSLTFVDCETYFVTFNGELYECVAWSGPYGSICIGNGSGLGGVETGSEPFVCMSYDDGDCYLIGAEAGTYTIKVQSAALEVAKKIDKKFLPDDIGGQVIIDSELSAESENPVQNKVVNEAISNVNEAISNLNTLVGDTPVSEQINAAITEIPEGFSGSWNDLTDKPFEASKTYTWSANDEYSESISFDGETAVKISNDAPDHSSFIGGTAFIAALHADGHEITLSGTIGESDVVVIPEFSNYYAILDGMIAVVSVESLELPNGVVLTKGIWALGLSSTGVISLSVSTRAKTLDESVIPDAIARKDDFYHHKKGNLIHSAEITTTKASESTTLASRDFNADFMSSLTLGDWYIVEFNGVEYMCRYAVNPYGSATLNSYYLGNIYMQYYYNWTDAGNKTEEEVVTILEALRLKDSGEPFSIDSYHQIYTKVAGTHTVNIYKADIIGIDEQYIPNAFIHIDDLYDRGTIHPVTTYYQWDDNVVYDEVVVAPEGQSFTGYAKISNDTPESSFFVDKYVYMIGYERGIFKSDWVQVRSDYITAFDGYYSILNTLFVVTADTVDVNGVTLTKGIWVTDGQDKSQGAYIMKMRFTDSNKIISETVIPDTIARKSDISDSISTPITAQVGQTIVVKAVDENGKPTEWEAVDPWVMTSTTEGSNKKFKLTVDDNGSITIAEITEEVN